MLPLTLTLPKPLAEWLPGRLGNLAGRPVVSVVRLHGVITASAGPWSRMAINLSTMEPMLRRAFAPSGLVAVALVINSPGGSPTQSALVADRIRRLAEKREVPVLAFCEDVAASGGYWLACAADEIYAHPTSLVGSIGVITQSFGLAGLLERLGVERRLYTAGTHKARLDPFLPEKEDDVAWLTGMQTELHELFKQWVVQRRGPRLGAAAEVFTGEIWTAAPALELGLIDGTGTVAEVLADRYPEANPVPVQGRRSPLSRIGMAGSSAGEDRLLALLEVAEQRASWARFGL